jgi:hypothetical protein
MADPTSASADDYRYDLFSEIFGALNEAPPEDQGKLLKAFLCGGIDTMREHTAMQLDMLEKLASIALDNVQDVRLYSLEARVRELEAGKPVTFGQIFGELVFVIAMEVVVLAGVTAAAPVLAGVGALILTNIKTSARSANITRRAAVRSSNELEMRRSNLVVEEMRLLQRLHARSPRGKPNNKQRRALRRQRTVSLDELHMARTEVDYLDQNRAFEIQRMTQDSVEALAARYQDTTRIRFSKNIERLMHDYAHHLDAGKEIVRAFELEALARMPQAFPQEASNAGSEDGELHDAFTTSHSVMQMIAQCESLKLDVNLHFSQMRAMLDAINEDTIFESFETVLVMEELDNNLFSTIDVTERMLASLDDFVVPMELAIWLTYLEANGVLDRETSPSNRTVSVSLSKTGTRFVANDFVNEVTQTTAGVTDSPRATYSGRRYAGLHVLDENQAYYLFHKFAKKVFDAYADRVPVAKTTELTNFIHRHVLERAYDDVLAMPKTYFWSGDNVERRDLIKEMGIVVIEYFNFVRDRILSKKTLGFSDTIPEGTAIADLFGVIEKPLLNEQRPEESAPTATATEWLEDQEAVHLAQWEERALQTLAEREAYYDEALAHLEQMVAAREVHEVSFPGDAFHTLYIAPAERSVLSARSSIEHYIGELENDAEGRTSDAIEARIDELLRKVASCPVEKEMFSTFPR